MRIFLSLIIFLAAALPLTARNLIDDLPRERPDLDSIYNEITDRTSPFYYPRLMDEFERNDTTMKLDKYRRLYLGAMLREDYDAYGPNATRTAMSTEIVSKPMLTRAECDSIIEKASAVLADNPFDLIQMYNLQRAYRSRGRTTLADVWNYKIRQILMAILSTGTGADEDNAWYVIHPSHEYILLNALGLTAKKHVFIEPYYEYILVTDSEGNDLGGFYFNIAAPIEEYWRKNPIE